jgi:hypothetical protein
MTDKFIYNPCVGTVQTCRYDSLKGTCRYNALKGDSSADPYEGMKGLGSRRFNPSMFKNKNVQKNALLIFCSNSLLKLSLLYLLGTSQNPSYPYFIGITFIFFTKKSRCVTTSSRCLTTTESLPDDNESIIDDNSELNFKLFLEEKYS